VQQTRANLGFGTPRQLVGQHDVADGQAGFPGSGKEFVANRTGGQRRGVLLDPVGALAVSSTMKRRATE